ncbi:unnamed protein product [Rhizoctonia solani]|uniref:Fungal-specific transcription factor domain protein n=1 Tax=Rhizoctonia solani TaxID=456999 RepID=A0A8H2WG81_9AGAM|nr:unnamed protein product [Rhizoctonia solani]
MSYNAISQFNCLDCRKRGTVCLCDHLNRECRTHVGAGTLDYRPMRTEILSYAAVTQDTTQTALLVGMRFESRQPEPMKRPQVFNNPRLTKTAHGASSMKTKCLQFDPYHSSSQLAATQQPLTPPYTPDDLLSCEDHCPKSLEPAGFLESIFSLGWPGDQPNRVSQSLQAHRSIEPSQSDVNSDEPEDPEHVQGAMVGFLSLDRNVESNGLPFILQAYATWMSLFLFEPLRVVNIARNDVSRSYILGGEYRQIMNLVAITVYEHTRSSDYDSVRSPYSSMAEAILRRRLSLAGAHAGTSRDVDRQMALLAILRTCEFIAGLCDMGSLSRALSFMQYMAPVFRRACPGPLDGLVNLPTVLTSMGSSIQFYATFDVVLGVLTGRPMFFRYAVNFSPEVPESLFFIENGPGMRWKFGFPDRLLLTFARMNGLYEDFGTSVPNQLVDELKEEIERTRPIVSNMDAPALAKGRIVVQECWILAALIYLYMGLCGACSTDAGVASVRTRFMRTLALVEPKRSVDSFLVFPLVILGLAADDWDERIMIRRRMLGVSECTRPGTLGNDFLRMLDSIWSKRSPVVWSDLRQACWEVSGV